MFSKPKDILSSHLTLFGFGNKQKLVLLQNCEKYLVCSFTVIEQWSDRSGKSSFTTNVEIRLYIFLLRDKVVYISAKKNIITLQEIVPGAQEIVPGAQEIIS